MPEIDKADGTASAAEQAEKRTEKPIGLCVASAGLHAASTHRKKRSFRNKGSRVLKGWAGAPLRGANGFRKGDLMLGRRGLWA